MCARQEIRRLSEASVSRCAEGILPASFHLGTKARLRLPGLGRGSLISEGKGWEFPFPGFLANSSTQALERAHGVASNNKVIQGGNPRGLSLISYGITEIFQENISELTGNGERK